MDNSKTAKERIVSLESLYPDIYSRYPEYLTQQQAAEICQVTTKTIRLWQIEKIMPSAKRRKKQGHRQQIKLDDAVICLLERKWAQETYNLFPEALKAFYTKRYKSFPDGLLIHDVAVMTGYSITTVHRWLRSGNLRYYCGGNKFRIPKMYLIDFVCGPYFQCKERKSSVQKADIKSFIDGITHQILSSSTNKMSAR